MTKKDILFWDVDTQADFIMPEGKLYIPGAQTLVETISDIRRFALDQDYSMIASTDWHSPDDPEISDTPDYRTTFPPHCLAHRPGAERVGYRGVVPMDIIDQSPAQRHYLHRLVAVGQYHIVLRKSAIDVFTNPNTIPLLHAIRPRVIVVFGVVLDFCVRLTVETLLRESTARLIVLSDAVKGLGAVPDKVILNEFRTQGVHVLRFDDLRAKLNVAA
jgi:nicotinamidase/pyrazinamidase